MDGSSLTNRASRLKLFWLCFFICGSLAWTAAARVERVEIEGREAVAGGQSFASQGAYEKLTGKIHYLLDPANPANRAIVDLDLAPRGADGKVRFHGDFMLLQPKDPQRLRGSILLEVPNRGRRTLFEHFHGPLPQASQGRTGQLAGLEEPLLLERGLRLLWVGWQGDTPYDPELLSLQRLEVTKDSEGLLRSDHVFSDPAPVMPLAHRNHRPYGVSAPSDPRNRLTVRSSPFGPRQTIARQRWRFARLDRAGKVVADPFWVHLEGGFEVGKIYEVVYVARRSWVAGLGLAAIRDAASFFRHGAEAEKEPIPGLLPAPVIAFGASQGGRLLRQMLHEGFAVDEAERQVFDGLWIHVAGAGRGSFNHRFAEPSRESHAFSGFLYPSELLPMQGTPSQKGGEGLYDRWRTLSGKADKLPAKVMTTHSSYEYWGRAASLTHTSPDGKRDSPLDANERLYLLPGSQHFVATFPPQALGTKYATNPHSTRFAMRALLVALDDWVRQGKPPPASRYPRLEDSTLVPVAAWRFPSLPGVMAPQHPYQPRALDFGRRFEGLGIIDHQPPRPHDLAWGVGLPAVDADGNERAGLPMPEVMVPVATYSGWNLRSTKTGASQEMAEYRGAFLPFQCSTAGRRATEDPRPSLEERYGNRAEYLRRFQVAAEQSRAAGALLAADLPALNRHAESLWRLICRK